MYTPEELQNALRVISSTIRNCEKIRAKFKEGTPQFSLLRNRIKALNISKDLINRNDTTVYSKKELETSLLPVISIINKTEKAQAKYEKGTSQYKRFSPIIKAMIISKSLIMNEITKRN